MEILKVNTNSLSVHYMQPEPRSSPQILFPGICYDGIADFKPII